LIPLPKLGDLPEEVLHPAVQILLLQLLRTELVLQVGSDALDVECLLFSRDICGGFEFSTIG